MRAPSLRRISGSSCHQSQPSHIVIHQPKVAHGRRQSRISTSRQARLPETWLSFQQLQELFLREPCLFDDGEERSSADFVVPRHGEGLAVRRFQDDVAPSLPHRLETDLRQGFDDFAPRENRKPRWRRQLLLLVDPRPCWRDGQEAA